MATNQHTIVNVSDEPDGKGNPARPRRPSLQWLTGKVEAIRRKFSAAAAAEALQIQQKQSHPLCSSNGTHSAMQKERKLPSSRPAISLESHSASSSIPSTPTVPAKKSRAEPIGNAARSSPTSSFTTSLLSPAATNKAAYDADLLKICTNYRRCSHNRFTSIKEPFDEIVNNFGDLIIGPDRAHDSHAIHIHRQTTSNPLPNGVLLFPLNGATGECLIDFSEVTGFTIGRGCRLVKHPNPLLSRSHCMIFVEKEEAVFVKDCDSQSGTFLNGKLLASSTATSLNNFDIVQLGYPIAGDNGQTNTAAIQFLVVFLAAWRGVSHEKLAEMAASAALSPASNSLKLCKTLSASTLHLDSPNTLADNPIHSDPVPETALSLAPNSPNSPMLSEITANQPRQKTQSTLPSASVRTEHLRASLGAVQSLQSAVPLEPNAANPVPRSDPIQWNDPIQRVNLSQSSPLVQKDDPVAVARIPMRPLSSPLAPSPRHASQTAPALRTVHSIQPSSETAHEAVPVAELPTEETEDVSFTLSASKSDGIMLEKSRAKKNLSRSIEELIAEDQGLTSPELVSEAFVNKTRGVCVKVDEAAKRLEDEEKQRIIAMLPPGIKIPKTSPLSRFLALPMESSSALANPLASVLSVDKERIQRIEKRLLFVSPCTTSTILFDFGSFISDISDGAAIAYTSRKLPSVQLAFNNYRNDWQIIGHIAGTELRIEPAIYSNVYSLSIRNANSMEPIHLASIRFNRRKSAHEYGAQVDFDIADEDFRKFSGIEPPIPLSLIHKLALFYPSLKTPRLRFIGMPIGANHVRIRNEKDDEIGTLLLAERKSDWSKHSAIMSLNLADDGLNEISLMRPVIEATALLYTLRYHL
jgi:hypothetical protein